ncbi:hypothetical protein Tco_0706086 [Tanacetum coccineum]|uniref:Retroviral polymerase SH3-like domain-containing protein n=1 Tax=Tanacetum coccineum TaxID=301880 RepID=A0ABQ4Y6J5_9ASTR
MAAGDSNDALVCCVENTVEDHIMDSVASFHATYCKEELDRFRLRSGLKRRLISVGQLDEEGYHVGFKDQQWWFRKVEESFLYNVSEDKETSEVGATGVAVGNGSDEMRYSFWDSKSHKIVRSRDFTFNEDPLYGDKNATYSSNLTKPNHKDQVVLEDSPENLANKSIVAEHVLSSEITHSPGESLDMSEGSKNSESFKDSGRSCEKDSDDGASSEEEGSDTPQVRRSNRESRAPVRYSPSASCLLLIDSYSEVLSSKESVQWKKVINEEISSA